LISKKPAHCGATAAGRRVLMGKDGQFNDGIGRQHVPEAVKIKAPAGWVGRLGPDFRRPFIERMTKGDVFVTNPCCVAKSKELACRFL
jgi:hypothetical protein